MEKLSFTTIIKNYLSLLTSVAFIGSVLCLILAYAIMIAFNVIGPFLLQESFHVSVINYGKLLLIVGFCYFLGATLNSRLIKPLTIHQLITAGLLLTLLSAMSCKRYSNPTPL
ncbi:MAG: multidrug effflux MFS transporter [Gammaproteobacteria bacterium]|nr:multidrug effflux MFS transporter [Gammaproteobacteria bacterium]